jgi:hypothetical protein
MKEETKSIQRVFEAIEREREYQDNKWGPADGVGARSISDFLLILRAELKEAEEAWVSSQGDMDVLLEILQVVSVGVACLQQHGVMERPHLQTLLREGPTPVSERIYKSDREFSGSDY